jgi:N6-L-threonylcarbamoyladenine synthase
MQSRKGKARKTLNILAIETSCDETSVSCLSLEALPNSEFSNKFSNKFPFVTIHSHKVESQTVSHIPFGGVVPEIAARDHLARIEFITKESLLEAGWKPQNISHIAVTLGPGLIGSVMVGVLFARGLALSLNVPLLGINHVDAHLAPAILAPEFNPKIHLKKQLKLASENLFPALALTLSGGHCHLSRLENPFVSKIILGSTVDDACGEAFDKVAKLLGFEYPGGPEVEKWAALVSESEFVFPKSTEKLEFNFSFSGLKTSVLDCVRKLSGSHQGKISGKNLPPEQKAQICFSFQNAAFQQIEQKINLALKKWPGEFNCLLVAGGVACNKNLRERLNNLNIPVQYAPLSLCSDNATMIGLHAWFSHVNGFTHHPFSKYIEL